MKQINRFRCDKRVHKSHTPISITRARTDKEIQSGVRQLTHAEAQAEINWFLNLKGGLSNIKDFNKEFATAINSAQNNYVVEG